MTNNIRFAFRNILKNRTNSLITVIGLTVGFTCLLLIYLYVSQEINYNNFHEKKDKIFRANYTIRQVNNSESEGVLFDQKLTEVIKDKVPQVNNCTAFRSAHGPTLTFENINFEENLYITEADFFDMFSFKLLFGNKDKLFQNPDEIVITASLANKFQAINSCSKEELLGKNVFFPKTGNRPFVISGILEDVPKNSSLQFDALIPYKYSETFPWSDNVFGKSSIFYEINHEENALIAEQQVSSAITEYYQEVIIRAQGWKYLAKTNDCFEPFALSLNDVYLSKINSDYERTNSLTSLYILSVIGFLIFIIACSNFMMLTLGQSFKKVKEIGVRKAIGARTQHIFKLFFTENIIITLTAFILGTALCYVLLPVFNTLAQNEIYIELIGVFRILVFVTFILFAVVLATSTIPIVKLLKIPSNQISSKIINNRSKNGGTQTFVTLQYILSIVLIILTLSIVNQTNYMKHKDLGFSAENIMNLRVYHLSKNEKMELHDQLVKNPGIIDHTFTDRNYVSGRSSGSVKDKNGDLIEARILNVDYNYISTLDLTLLQGENFTPAKSGDQSTIINEKLASILGITQDAIGQTISLYGENIRVIGIVKDFHFDSMQKELEPLMLTLRTDYGARGKFVFIKYHPEQLSQLIPFVQNTWKKIAPGKELDFKFWDEQLNERYQSEERWSQIIAYTSIIAIIISSLGLFGLTLLVINRRIKEIGIRKISGAKVSEILTMLNKDFIKWVAIAFVVACPIAYYTMNKWLENFAYKTSLSWWIFALAGLLALGIALLTVSWQSWRAATRNPVEALRYE